MDSGLEPFSKWKPRRKRSEAHFLTWINSATNLIVEVDFWEYGTQPNKVKTGGECRNASVMPLSSIKWESKMTEKEIAIMEANMIYDSDSYFDARTDILATNLNKRIFDYAYKMAWKACMKQYHAGVVAPLKTELHETQNKLQSILNGDFS